MQHHTDEPEPRPRTADGSARSQRQEPTRAAIQDTSDDLLQTVDEIRRLEAEKREVRMSTPEFHDLARRIEHKARQVFGLARSQREIGDTLRGRQRDSINEQAAKEEEPR